MFTKELTDLGLNKGEAEIYSSLLKFGDASASEIAKKTNIGRTNVYEYANSLLKRGLVTQYEKSNKIFFRSEDPKLLRDLLDQRKREVRELEVSVANVLEKMDSYYSKNSNIPRSSYYHGVSGYKEVVSNYLMNQQLDEIIFLIPDLDLFEPLEPKVRNTLVRNQTMSYLVANKGSMITEFNKRDIRELRKTSIVSKADFEITSEMIILRDMIIYGNLSKKSFAANIIESKDLARLISSAATSIKV